MAPDHRARKQLKADHRRGWVAGQAGAQHIPTLSGNDGFARLHPDLVKDQRRARSKRGADMVMIANADTARQQDEISLLSDAIKRPVDVGAMIV